MGLIRDPTGQNKNEQNLSKTYPNNLTKSMGFTLLLLLLTSILSFRSSCQLTKKRLFVFDLPTTLVCKTKKDILHFKEDTCSLKSDTRTQ